MPRGHKKEEIAEGDRFTIELDPDPELGLISAHDDEDDHVHDLYLESVETLATIDAIEPDDDDGGETDRYRISMHATVSEAAAQQLFAAFVRKGRLRIALLPSEEDGHYTAEA